MLKKSDIKIEYTKGKGPGGQHKNKVETMVVATHIPTGIKASVDGRSRKANQVAALKELEYRVRQKGLELQAKANSCPIRYCADFQEHISH
jgi:protein subunit release factor A